MQQSSPSLSSLLLSNGPSTDGHHLDSTSSYLEQISGLLHQAKTALAARSGFFSSDSLKTVSNLISAVPAEVTALQQMRSIGFFSQSSGVDDRSLAFQDGIKYMSYNPESEWTESLQKAAMEHMLLHNSQLSSPGSGELTISRVRPPSTASCNLPAPEEVYQLLLSSESKESRTVHPYGVSSLVFAFASLISLSIHHPTSCQSTNNNRPSYFDLSPLYGFTPDDTEQIRLKDGTGMLAPDCFCEERVTLFPPAVSAILILWNRNHNYIARRLSTSNAERLKRLSQESKDDHIFQIARLINCANFRNVIAVDFLKGLMGLSAADPDSNVNIMSDTGKAPNLKIFFESTFCYNWSSVMSISDAIAHESMAKILNLENGGTANIHTAQIQGSFKISEIDKDRSQRSYPGLTRPSNGQFKDENIAQVLQQATEHLACAFGSRQVPLCARAFELQRIEEARNSNVCSLNEYRKALGLKQHKSFIDWNSDIKIANLAEQLYKHIDNLELYVGLHAEEAVPCGFGLGYTMTYGLLTDLVSRIRSDPTNAKITEQAVTLWGYRGCQIDPHNGAFGNCFPKILLRNLPRHYPPNNVYSLFPFCTPISAIDCLKQNPQLPGGIDHSEYDHDAPKQPIVHTLATKETISHVLNNPDTYRTPYGERLRKLTDGYGYFLGFDDEILHDRDQIMTLHALIPDSGSTLRQYAATMRNMTKQAIVANSKPSGMGDCTIDIVKDVINPVCTRWVCQTLCDYNLRPDKPDPEQVEDTEHMNEKEMHEAFGALYTYVFRNSDPEHAWIIRRKAMRASEILCKHIRNKIPIPKWLQTSSRRLQKSIHVYVYYCERAYKALFYPKGWALPAFTAQTFLERLVQSRRSVTMDLDLPDQFNEIRKRAKAISRGQDEDDLKDQELEVSRIVANVLGLAVVTSVNFPLALIQAIDFYMDEKRAKERAEIIRLSLPTDACPTDPNAKYLSAQGINKVLMGYIREAQRIEQPLFIWRDVVRDGIIYQGSNDILVHKGDRIFVDFHKYHNNPTIFQSPHNVDVNRRVPSIQGLGLHKCPALQFIDQTMPEILKVIFQLPNIRRGPGETGQLIKTKSTANPLDSDPVLFLNQAKEFHSLPQNLILEYDADPKFLFGSDKAKAQEKTWHKMTSPVSQHESMQQWVDYIMKCLIVTLLGLFAIWVTFYMMWPTKKTSVPPITAENVKHKDILCPGPIKLWHNWEVVTMTHSQNGIPRPLSYISNNSTAHRLSVLDADKRDMRMAIYVDDTLLGFTSEFDLNLEEDCGLDIRMCAEKNFSRGLVVIPAGKRQVRIEWDGKEYMNNTQPDLGQDNSRRLFWERADCGH